VFYAGKLGRARSRSIGIEGAKVLPRWVPRVDALVGLEHELWGTLELVGSRLGSNVRTLVIPDSVNLRRLFEPFEGQASNP
jgi:hypothetical protein